jgi:hypothetical protein
MAVVIPTQNRNAAVATDNTTKVMAINLKIPLKLALPYDISSAFDDWTVGGRMVRIPCRCTAIARSWRKEFPGCIIVVVKTDEGWLSNCDFAPSKRFPEGSLTK